MGQKINCRFYEYLLPENARWLDQICLPVAESFGAPGYRHERKFSFTLEQPDLLLSQKTFRAEPALTGKDEVTKFEILRWDFRLIDGEQSEIDVLLREPKPSPFERWFASRTGDTQFLLVLLTLILPLTIIGVLFALLSNYPEPQGFWIWFGLHIRPFVGWSLFLLTLGATVWLQIRFRDSSFGSAFFSLLSGVLILAVPIVWSQVSLPTQPVTPGNAIAYLDELRSRAAAFALLLTGIVPWITLFLKWLGLDLLSSIVNLVADKRKK